MVRKYLLRRETQKEHDIVRKQSLDERFHNAGQNQQKQSYGREYRRGIKLTI